MVRLLASPWLWFILLFQSAGQAFLFSFFFKSEHRLRDFAIFFGLFVFVLFPLDSLPLLQNNVILRNVTNMVLQYGTCCLLFRKESSLHRLQPVLANELCQVLSETTGILITMVLLGRAPIADPNVPELWILYFLTSLVMLFYEMFALRTFSKAFTISMRLNLYLYSLLITLILCLLCAVIGLIPNYHPNFGARYLLLGTLLVLINILTFFSLLKTMKRASEMQALKQIHHTYAQQVEACLQNEKQEEKLRRLRHDLKNYLTSQETTTCLQTNSGIKGKGEK